MDWSNNNPRYGYFEDFHSRQADNPTSPVETILYSETKDKYMPYVPPSNQIVPVLAFGVEESSEIAEIEAQLKDYVIQMIASFVIGETDLDKDWDSYIGELNNIGLKRYLDLYQDAYENNMK